MIGLALPEIVRVAVNRGWYSGKQRSGGGDDVRRLQTCWPLFCLLIIINYLTIKSTLVHLNLTLNFSLLTKWTLSLMACRVSFKTFLCVFHFDY